MPPARPPTSGFDITPAPPLAPRPPNAAAAARRPAGLSRHDKALLGLAVVAFLGAAALVADALSVRDGYTPAKGFREVDRQADRSGDAGGANGASAAAPDGSDGSGAGVSLANLTGAATSTSQGPAAVSAGSPTSASGPSSGPALPTPPPVTTSSSSSSASVATTSSSTSSSSASSSASTAPTTSPSS